MLTFHSARGSIFSDADSDSGLASEQHQAEPNGLCSAAAGADIVITVCVGGTHFTTTLTTLTAAPGSYLATLFSGRWTPSVFLPGTRIPFIDRDPDSFKYVLAYLRSLHQRDSKLVLPDEPLQLKQLRAEADFYGLVDLSKACSMGRLATSLLAISNKQQQLQQQHPKYREPTFSLLQRQQSQSSGGGSGSGASENGFGAALQAVRDQVRHPTAQTAAAAAANTGDSAGDAPVSGDDVQINMQQQQPSDVAQAQPPCLAQCVYQAQQLLVQQQAAWSSNTQWQQLADLILKHLLHLPLAAQQPDLVAALANPEPCTRLEFLLQYYPVGDVRIEVECRLVPAGAASTAATAAGAWAAAAAAGGSSSPHILSPRGPGGSAAAGAGGAGSRPGTPAAGEAVGGAAAAAAAGGIAGAGVTPGPGWGGVTVYHRFSIKETSDRFIQTTYMPGEALHVEEAARAAFKQELNKYSTLHKLLVQQSPRASVAGLMWLLEAVGFSSVGLATLLDTYYVGVNSFPGFKSIITLEL